MALELTQEQLAHRASVTLRTVQRWEHGAGVPNGVKLVQVADALGVPPTYLFSERGEKS